MAGGEKAISSPSEEAGLSVSSVSLSRHLCYPPHLTPPPTRVRAGRGLVAGHPVCMGTNAGQGLATVSAQSKPESKTPHPHGPRGPGARSGRRGGRVPGAPRLLWASLLLLFFSFLNLVTRRNFPLRLRLDRSEVAFCGAEGETRTVRAGPGRSALLQTHSSLRLPSAAGLAFTGGF